MVLFHWGINVFHLPGLITWIFKNFRGFKILKEILTRPTILLPNYPSSQGPPIGPNKKKNYYLVIISICIKLISRINKTKWSFNILLISWDVLYIFTNYFMKCYICVVCAMNEIYVCTMHPFSSKHFFLSKNAPAFG